MTYEEYLLEIFLNLLPAVLKMSFKDISFLALVAILYTGRNHLCNFCRGHYKEYFCEIILICTSGLGADVIKKSILALIIILFSGVEPFVQFWLNLDQWFRKCCSKKNSMHNSLCTDLVFTEHLFIC